MQYVYAAIWFLVGLILIARMGRENRIFYLAGGFFLFLGGWWLADILLTDVDLMAAPWSWVLRGISAVMLLILGAFYFKSYNKDKEAMEAERAEALAAARAAAAMAEAEDETTEE